MINIAGRSDAKRIIEEELERVGVPIYDFGGTPVTPDSNTTIGGKLKGFTFKRLWYYYSVVGKFPLGNAIELYKTPVGKKDIRVSGDCSCPAPEGVHIKRWDKSGRRIIETKERDQFKKLIFDIHPGAKEKFNKTNVWEDEAEYPFFHGIDMYHVDSELGLYMLVQEIKSLPDNEDYSIERDY